MQTKIKNKRYGEFRFSDYLVSWVVIAILLFFVITTAVLTMYWYTLLYTVFSAIWILVIVTPNREEFVINNESIEIIRGSKNHSIDLPSELTLVVSDADISTPLFTLIGAKQKTHILKDKIAISILQNSPLDVTLSKLYQNFKQYYTTSSIQNTFNDYHYIYCFVCDQSLFDELIASRKCLVIIPERLLDKLSIDPDVVELHIDKRTRFQRV